MLLPHIGNHKQFNSKDVVEESDIYCQSTKRTNIATNIQSWWAFSLTINLTILLVKSKGTFKYYAILCKGKWGGQKGHRISQVWEREGGSKKDHSGLWSQGRGNARFFTYMKVLKREIITSRISYQGVVQEIISSLTNMN